MREKLKMVRVALESGVLSDFCPNSKERDLEPIIIAVVAWCDGDEKALKPWPNIARFFAIRSELPPK